MKPFSLLALLLAATGALAQTSAIVTLPDAPSQVLPPQRTGSPGIPVLPPQRTGSLGAPVLVAASAAGQDQAPLQPAPQTRQATPQVDRDADGNLVPLEHQ